MACEYVPQECDDEESDDVYVSDYNVSDISLLKNKLRQSDSHLDVQRESEETTTERDTYKDFVDAVHNLSEANVDNNKSCARCSKRVRVENVSSFRKSQHIAIPGKLVRKFLKYWHKMVHMYQHHAIIKEIKLTSGTQIKMEVIHFYKVGKKVEICQFDSMYDLVHDELYIFEYIHPRYSADEIVQRAESMLPTNNNGQHTFGNYNVLTNNCEHFATWCVVGDGESFQSQAWQKRTANFVQRLSGVGTKVTFVLLRLLHSSSDEISRYAMFVPSIQEYVLVGTAGLYLIYCVVMTVLYSKAFLKGHLCKACLKGKLQDLWISFAVYCVTSIPAYILMKFVPWFMHNPIGISIIIGLVLLSVVLQWSIPKIRKALQSPFADNGKRIEKLSEIKTGDVALLKYFKIEHAVIVTQVHEDNEVSTKGRIKGVHYGLPCVFGRRKVMEETFTINLEKTTVKKIDCSFLLTNPPNITVLLARKRVGEKKWALTSNRSDHLCYWAKVQQRPRGDCENLGNRNTAASSINSFSSLYQGETEVHLFGDLQLGDVIKYKKTGILVGKKVVDSGKGRRFQIEMIVYELGWYIRNNTYTVDLNKDSIVIKRYHPAHCYPLAERRNRAKRLEGKKGTWWTNKGFIKHCILLPCDSPNGHT